MITPKMKNGMDKERELILAIIKELVSGTADSKIPEFLAQNKINWEKFKEFVIYHDLAPFAYSSLKNFNTFLPRSLTEFLKNNYYCALVHCQNIWQEFLRIFDKFEEAGIPLLPIKGIALLKDLYSHNPVRPMTDIDLLVREEDLPRAERLFQDLGYRKELYGLTEEYWRENQCHIAFYKKEGEKAPFIELHWSLDFKRKNRGILPGLWERTRQIRVDGRTVKLLSVEDTIFSLALHNRRFGRMFCLKNIYDLILLLNKYSPELNWEYLLSQSKRYDIRSTSFFIFCQARLLSESFMPEYLCKELKIPAWKIKLIQRLIDKSTFLLNKKEQAKVLYLKAHFLLYDSFWEPIKYILYIPQEQFAKFYNLAPYGKKTDFFYRNRFIYIPLKAIRNLIS